MPQGDQHTPPSSSLLSLLAMKKLPACLLSRNNGTCSVFPPPFSYNKLPRKCTNPTTSWIFLLLFRFTHSRTHTFAFSRYTLPSLLPSLPASSPSIHKYRATLPPSLSSSSASFFKKEDRKRTWNNPNTQNYYTLSSLPPSLLPSFAASLTLTHTRIPTLFTDNCCC